LASQGTINYRQYLASEETKVKNRNVRNYIALALCIVTTLTVEQVFDLVTNNPEIIETFNTIRV